MISETIKICGLDRNCIENKLTPYKDRSVEFSVDEKDLDAAIIMNCKLERAEFEIVKTAVYNTFEGEVYWSGQDSLEELAAKLLKLNGRTLSIAESFTGGEICSRLVSVPNVSENFYEGIICYNKTSKMARLDIPKSILGEFGAVSRETARAMVKGIVRPPTDIGLATTGLAGPKSGEDKPAGLVYIGVGGGEFITVFEKKLNGSRNEVRRAASNLALFYLIRYLKGDILRL